MKTPEQILTDHGLWNYADNIKLSRERLVALMHEYAAQFIHPQKCYSCNGAGTFPELGHQTCQLCQGVGKIVMFPPITTTLTQPPIV